MSKLPEEYNGIMVEGASEKAIMDLLINNNKLIFPNLLKIFFMVSSF